MNNIGLQSRENAILQPFHLPRYSIINARTPRKHNKITRNFPLEQKASPFPSPRIPIFPPPPGWSRQGDFILSRGSPKNVVNKYSYNWTRSKGGDFSSALPDCRLPNRLITPRLVGDRARHFHPPQFKFQRALFRAAITGIVLWFI